MSDHLIDLPPDLQGHFAAFDTADAELAVEPAHVRNVVYGILAALGEGRVGDAVELGYWFASVEFEALVDAGELESSDAAYDGFVDKRIEQALIDDEDEDEEPQP